jgi:hypothetical protein
MGDAIITRRGGKLTLQAIAPTVTQTELTENSIKFTVTNNDASTAVILWEVDDATPDENTIELASGVTSDEIEITGIDRTQSNIIYFTANVSGKIKSNVVQLSIPEFDFTEATGGITLEYDLDNKRYRSHTFTTSGTFNVTLVGDDFDDRNKVDYLVIAGGGGAGGINFGAGGGAGGYRTTNGTSGENSSAESKVTVTNTSYNVVVGAGGAGSTSTSVKGENGTTSSVSFTNFISTVGGGGGGSQGTRDGNNGGSGGGAAFNSSAGLGTADQGFNGAIGGGNQSGGGGGAGEQPADANTNGVGGKGGDGLPNLLRTGSLETRAGGGGGGGLNTNGANGLGGGSEPNLGGGGGISNNSKNGGSGIVVIRYEIAPN